MTQITISKIISNYLRLIKPSIVLSNMMSAAAGFLTASHGQINYLLLIYILVGISSIIASSCVLNNIIDQDIDAVMRRTNTRILIQNKTFSIKNSILYALILGILGFLCLLFTTNLLVILLMIIGLFIYVGIYSLWMKRKSIYSIIIGSISGAIPPVAGYCAASSYLDTGALILLTIFTTWQIPHSYAIAIFRSDDYKAASIPTFPAKKGLNLTKTHMKIFILGFAISNILLTISGYTSYIFAITITSINAWWLYIGYNPKQFCNNRTWAKKMFFLSIVNLISLNTLLSLDAIFLHK